MRKSNDIYFIGREAEYEKIEKWLFEEQEDQKPYAVSGPNDIGKSTLVSKVLTYNRDQIKQDPKMIYLKDISLMHYRDEEEFFEFVYGSLEEEVQDRLRRLRKERKGLEALEEELERLEHFEEGEECRQWMAKLQTWADRLHELDATEYAQYEKELAAWEQKLRDIQESLPVKRAEWEKERNRQAQITEQMAVWQEALDKLCSKEEDSTIQKNLIAAMNTCAENGISVILPIDEFDYADDREKYSDDFFRVLAKWNEKIHMILVSRKKLSRISDIGGTTEKQFSELFEPIVLRGFDNEELKEFFDVRFEPVFQAYQNNKVDAGERKEIEKKILYYCGRHPRLLSDMQKAIETYLKSSRSILLDAEKLEDILPQEMKNIFDRLYDLMRYEMKGQENGENLVELYLKCFGMLSCEEKENHWLNLLHENGYITKRKSDEDSLEKLFGFGDNFDVKEMLPECDGYEPISAYSLEHIMNRYLRDQKKIIREDIQSIVDTRVNSEEFQEAIEEAVRLQEELEASRSRIAELEQTNADLEQANEDLMGEWESAEARSEARELELKKAREENEALELRYLEKEEEIEKLYQDMEDEIAKRIEEQKKEWEKKAHLTLEDMLKELLDGKADETDIRVLIDVMTSHNFLSIFEDAVFAHYVMKERTDQNGTIATDFDYTPAVIMYFKLYEGILKEYHYEIYRNRMPNYVTDIKRYQNSPFLTFDELNSLPNRNKRMKMGNFYHPFSTDAVAALAALSGTTDTTLDVYKWWDKHRQWFDKIHTARNEFGAHYESRVAGKVTETEFKQLVRILFPTSPKTVNQKRSDGALIMACDLRSVFDRQEGAVTSAYDRESEEIRATVQAAVLTDAATDQN